MRSWIPRRGCERAICERNCHIVDGAIEDDVDIAVGIGGVDVDIPGLAQALESVRAHDGESACGLRRKGDVDWHTANHARASDDDLVLPINSRGRAARSSGNIDVVERELEMDHRLAEGERRRRRRITAIGRIEIPIEIAGVAALRPRVKGAGGCACAIGPRRACDGNVDTIDGAVRADDIGTIRVAERLPREARDRSVDGIHADAVGIGENIA